MYLFELVVHRKCRYIVLFGLMVSGIYVTELMRIWSILRNIFQPIPGNNVCFLLIRHCQITNIILCWIEKSFSFGHTYEQGKVLYTYATCALARERSGWMSWKHGLWYKRNRNLMRCWKFRSARYVFKFFYFLEEFTSLLPIVVVR